MPLVVDNYFCSKCEKIFSSLENDYAKSLDEYFEKSNYHISVKNEIQFLFWSSIIWRLSILDSVPFKLKSSEENRLRELLNYLDEDLSKINFYELKNDSKFNSIGYKLLRSPNYSKNQGTCLYCNPALELPYSLIIDEFVLLFYFKESHVYSSIQTFFGFENEYINANLNKIDNINCIRYIDHPTFKGYLNNLLKSLVKRRLDSYVYFLNVVHQKIGGKGKEMPLKLKKLILEEFTALSKKNGDKYTRENFTKSIYEVIYKYNKSLSH